MLDFIVPNSPGWGGRVLAEGDSEEGYIGAISPKMLAAIDTLRETWPRTRLDENLEEAAAILRDKGVTLEMVLNKLRENKEAAQAQELGTGC